MKLKKLNYSDFLKTHKSTQSFWKAGGRGGADGWIEHNNKYEKMKK